MFFSIGSKEIQSGIRWVLYVFIAVFPFVLYGGYLFNGTSTRSINTVLVVEAIAVAVGIALLSKERKIAIVRSPVTGVLALLLVVLCIASLTGVDLNASFWSKATRTTGIFYFLHMALLYMFFWMAYEQDRALRIFLKVFSISAGLFAVVSVLGQEGVGWLFASKGWAGLTIGNSTFAGMYLYAAFMVAVYLVATTTTKKWWKNLFLLVFIVNPYILNFDIFRGLVQVLQHPASIIGSAQASAVTLYGSIVALLGFHVGSKIQRSSIRRTLLLGTVAIGAIIFALLTHSLLTPGGRVQQMYLSQATATRPITWQFSQQAIAERPLFGWGVDNFDIIFQKYYDPRILELKNGGEAWLDRAHNIFIDQTIESGYVGTVTYVLVYLVLLGVLLYVILRSKLSNDRVLASVLLVYFAGHLLELQTAFDTTVTYVPLLCFAAIAAILYARTRTTETKKDDIIAIARWAQISIGVILLIFGIGMFSKGAVPLMKAEGANGAIRRVGSSEKRIALYPTLFASPLDEGAFLWRTSNDIQRGVSLQPSVIEDPRQRAGLMQEFAVVVNTYEDYIRRNPDDYRAVLNLADVYIYQRLFEVDHLDKAHTVLNHAIELVPQSPQAYWMQAVAYLYQARFKEAKLWAQKAYDLNPNIEESTRVLNYINDSIKVFPVIDLYSFKQI